MRLFLARAPQKRGMFEAIFITPHYSCQSQGMWRTERLNPVGTRPIHATPSDQALYPAAVLVPVPS